jgi:hypothetical protein
MGSHVLPALMRKFHEAKESGSPEVSCGEVDECIANSSTSTTWPTRGSS